MNLNWTKEHPLRNHSWMVATDADGNRYRRPWWSTWTSCTLPDGSCSAGLSAEEALSNALASTPNYRVPPRRCSTCDHEYCCPTEAKIRGVCEEYEPAADCR